MVATKPREQSLFLLFVLILGIAGAIALALSTPYGLGLVNDSAAYIGGAVNLLAGNGYARISGGGEIKPITHFPPFYSILLAGMGLIGFEVFQAVRIVNIVLFALSVILVGISVYAISGSAPFALFGASLLASSDVHLEIYAVALSEGLFLVLMLSAYLLLARYFKDENWKWMALAGITLGLAYLTRYAAVSLWITSVLVLVLLGSSLHANTLRNKLRPILILLGSGLPFVLTWFIIEMLSSEGIGNRLLAWHPMPAGELLEALKNLLTWLAPDDVLRLFPFTGRLLSALSLLFLPALVIWLVWRYKQRTVSANRVGFVLAFTLAVHILVYLAFLIFSRSLLDASTPFDDRLLSVIYLPAMILFASALAWLWRASRAKAPVFNWVILVACLGLLAFSFKDGVDSVAYLSREGIGFTNRGWRESPALQAIKDLPADLVIYSDRPTGIFLLTGRSAYTIPTRVDPVTTKERPGYEADLQSMHAEILSGKAVLVLFDLSESREPDDILLVNDLTEGLHLQNDYGIVTIYGR